MTLVAKKVNYPVFKKNQADDSFKFQPLPQPSGAYPFHLDLHSVIDPISPTKMVFHMVGDTGSIKHSQFQRLVSREMIQQYREAAVVEDKPQFLYHLGDVVYTYGEAENYYRQFFDPYREYPGPVFAIAGNHDGDVNPAVKSYKSLDAFMKVFCDETSRPVIFCKDANRKSLTQPNIYWTLETPLANIVGLYGNVPKYGMISEEQRNWFYEELKTAQLQRPEKAIIVCVHHAPYSADSNHSSSPVMIEFLEEAFKQTGVRPDIVFSGHVHNYQRFSRHYADGSFVPFIVAGAGGYDDLHSLVTTGDNDFFENPTISADVRLEGYCDNKHGFLKITIERTGQGLMLTGEYFSIVPEVGAGDGLMAHLEEKFHVLCGGRGE
jgi:predicted phosphodiesterase